MSYSSLILKDSPHCVWALEESSGLTVEADAFIGSAYNGDYVDGKFLRSPIPIVFGGKYSIHSDPSADYSLNNMMFSVPSFGIFSFSRKSTAYSLEFWMMLEQKELDMPQSPTNKTGDSKIVGLTDAEDCGIFIRDSEYLVFRIGDNGNTIFESAVHVPNFNEPIHIVATYSTNTIQLIVNGVPGNITEITDNIFTAQAERDLEFFYPQPINDDALTLPFSRIAFDSVAIYFHGLNTSIAKRHYVYGIGYDVPKNIIKAQGGVSYSTNMQLTKPLKQINYLGRSTWTNTATFDNLLLSENNVSTIKYNNQKMYISSELNNKTEKDMVSSSSDYFLFPQDSFSYIEIDNYESITSGTTKRINAKFMKGSGTEVEQLLYIGSKISPEIYISFVIEGQTVTGYVKKYGEVEEVLVTRDLLDNSFYISISNNNNTISATIGDSQGYVDPGTVEYPSSGIFPLQNSYIRFGTSPVFFGNSTPNSVTVDEINRFTGRLYQVDIDNGTQPIAGIDNYPSKGIANLYQMYANSETRSLCVATSGTISMTIPMVNLCDANSISIESNELNIGLRCEIGSLLADATYTLNKVNNGVKTSVAEEYENANLRGIHIPKLSDGNLVSDLQYDCTIVLRSTNIFTNPGILDFFRIFTYETSLDIDNLSYIDIVDLSPGDNIRYYSNNGTNNSPFTTVPDLAKTSDMFRSFNTGAKVGKSSNGGKPYLMIPFNVSTITSSSTPKVTAVMFSGILNENNLNQMSLLKYGSTEILGSNIEPSGITTYLNGQPYVSGTTEWNPTIWNHYTFVINSGIEISDTLEIFFGNGGSEWNIDNINIFTDELILNSGAQASIIKKMYDTYYGVISNRYGDGNASYYNFILNDEEISNGLNVYHKVFNQEGFISYLDTPVVASTQHMTFTGSGPYTFTFGTSIDLQKIDNVQLSTGDIVLLKNQTSTAPNGLYSVTKNSTTFTFTAESDPQDGFVVPVLKGSQNGNRFFKYAESTNTYAETDVQKKVVAYSKNNPSIFVVDK